ncbi:T9SS type A sorting domain-containing protein [Chryseobacterium sp. c4a]|uniref:T9SS type A sorting domain-containing protein n=1 Tax=Chryseobacterium sp. c4a TaxID=1573582 RepID=UPI00135A3A17|nr:T9SS type A sorting domain-containing protein [Chryseobacterium sp. c4a]
MKSLFFLIAIVCSITTLKSQWNPDLNQNLKVIDIDSEVYAFSAPMNNGKTYVAYWKKVNAPQNFELWLQILDQNGNRQLGANGILLSSQIPMSTYIAVHGIAVDSSNNLYLGVTGTENSNPGYLFKVTPQGTSAWPNGIALGEATFPKILTLSNGDILAAYAPTSEKYTKVQRFNPNGQAVWSAPLEIKSDDLTKETIPVNILELSNNECIILFNKNTGGINANLFAQKINLNGTTVWNAPKQISTKTTTITSDYSSFTDGNSVYCAFIGIDNNALYGYVQRINVDGNLPWGNDGTRFTSDSSNYQIDVKINTVPGSPHIWAIAHYTDSGQGMRGEFVQKFDKNTGGRLLTDNAKQIFPVDNNLMHHVGDLDLVNGNPFFVIQKKIDANSNALYAVLLNNNGDFSWPQQTLPMATFQASKTYITTLKPINGQNVITFQEMKSMDSTSRIYAQNLVLPNLSTREVKNNKEAGILFPNPATSMISIKGSKDQKYEIYNAAGQLIQSGNTKESTIPVHNLSKGVYILKTANQNKYTFIKE